MKFLDKLPKRAPKEKPKPNYVSTQVNDDAASWLKTLAEDQGQTISALVRAIIEQQAEDARAATGSTVNGEVACQLS